MAEALENPKGSSEGIVDKMLASLSDCINITDDMMRFQYINHSGAKILGCSEIEAIGKTWRQLNLKPDIREPLERNLRWVFMSGEVAIDTITTVDTGRTKFYEYTIIPIQDRIGRFTSALVSIRDMTEIRNSESGRHEISIVSNRNKSRKKSGREIDKLSQILNGNLEYSNTQIAYLDGDFNFLMVNNEFAKGMGCRHRKIIGRNYFDLFPRNEDEAIFKEVLISGKTVKREARSFMYGNHYNNNLEKGVTFWDWTIAPVKTDDESDKDITGLVFYIVDVTQTVKSKALSDVLNNISVSLRTTYDVDKIVRLATVKTARVLNCDYAGAVLKKNNRWVKKNLYGRYGSKSEIKYLDTGISESTMIITESGSCMDISVPLIIRDEIIGKLDFKSCAIDMGSYQMLADFTSKLAGTITLALENSRSYKAEEEIADTLQEALLTMPGNMDAVDFSHLYHSASEVARVGGDFYDLFNINRRYVGMMIGDVSGKGLEAAALTAIVRNTVRAYAMERYTPATVIKKTNDVIGMVTDSTSFATVLFAILDVDTGNIIYCNAGHSAAIVKRANGVELLEANSPIIGAFDNLEYYENEIYMKEGDIIVMYTDGVIEAREGEKFYGEERLLSFISEIPETTVDRLPENIFQEVVRFSNGVLSDDLALLTLALKRK